MGQNWEDGLWAEAKHVKHTLSKSQDQMWRRAWSHGEQGAGLRVKHAVCCPLKRAVTVQAERQSLETECGQG